MAKKNKYNKSIPFAHVVRDEKLPKSIENPDSYFKLKPTWSFSRCDQNHEKWSLAQCDDIFSSIILKLVDFERRTWADIENDKTHNHWIDASNLSREAQKRLKEVYPEFDKVFSLHLTGTLRLIGYILGGTYFIFWYDAEHEVCPSTKKHT
jgi:hypothetical protein